MDFTATWGWPQWAFLAWMLITLILTANRDGQVDLIEHGPNKGQVKPVNFGMALLRVALILFLLTAGGFFA